MAKLSVNVNKVATLRNTRPLAIPSVVGLSRVAMEAGAHGITVHPRPDHRHVRPDDVYAIAGLLRASFPAAEFNIEGNPFIDYVHYARDVRPTQCTLVPDTPEAYVHRVGRTGRAESTGSALTLVAPEELRALRALEKAVGVQLQ